MLNSQGIIFIGIRRFGDIFKSAFPQQNINQSETRIGDMNLLVELWSIFFRKPITENTHYLLSKSPMYLR